MKCIIPCAGKGTRLGADHSKALYLVGGQTILSLIVDAWREAVDEFVVVANPNDVKLLASQVAHLPSRIVLQEEPKGIADAILQAEPHVGERFLVVLGDCLHRGVFTEGSAVEQGIGVWNTTNVDELRKNYLVGVSSETGFVKYVKEKPRLEVKFLDAVNCGMGIYFLKRSVFDYIQQALTTSHEGELGITDILQDMIDKGEKFTPIWFQGDYINITYPEDLIKAKEIV